MQTIFSSEYMHNNCGCYAERNCELLKACSFMKKEGDISLKDIIYSEIPLNHKFWFLAYKTGLETEDLEKVTLKMFKIALPLYEDCENYEVIKDYINNVYNLQTEMLTGQDLSDFKEL